MHQNIEIDPKVIDTFNSIKSNGTNSYMVLKVNEEPRVVIERIGELGETWDSMSEQLPREDGRYIVFDYKRKLEEGKAVSKLLFAYWCSFYVPISRKIQLSTIKDIVEAKVPCQISFTFNEKFDLEETEILNQN